MTFTSMLIPLWILGAATIQAAEPAETHGDKTVESIVVSATRLDESSADLIGSYTSFGEDQLSLVQPVHIQQLLQRAPGINLHRGNGQEYLPAIRSPVLTGAGACGAFLMMEDNIPLRAAGFCNVNELFDAHTEQAQRVEVVRGPATAFYGSNALHGAINIITPDAKPGKSLNIGIEGGPYDYARTRLSAGGGSKNNAWRAGVTATHDGGYRDDSGFDQQKLTLRHHYRKQTLQVDSGFTYSNLNQETAGFIVGEDAYRDSSLARSNPTPEAARDTEALRLWSRFQYDRLQVVPYLRYADMTFRQHFLPGDPLEENGHRSIGVLSSVYLDATESRQLAIGLDGEFTRGFLKQSQADPTQGSAFLQETIPVGQHYDYQVDSFMAAPFVHLDWLLSDHWQLTAGLRYEFMDYQYDNRMLAGRTRDDGTACGFGGCRYSRPADRSDSFNNWSPKFGISYLIDADNRAYLNIARTFRAPQATELYRLQREQLTADLDSVELNSVELGVKGTRGRLDYALAAFAMRKENVISRDIDFFNISDGETTHRGIELQLDYRIADNWRLHYSGTYASHKYDNNPGLSSQDIVDNDIDTAPRYFGAVQLKWDLAPLQLELEWLHMGDYYLDPENLHSYPGHDLVNMRGKWQAGSRWTFYGQLINLGDAEYAERADFTSFTGARYFPGTPRSLFVGAQWNW